MSDICGCQNLPGTERGGRASTPLQCRHISAETGIRLPPTSAWYHFCTAKTMSWILKMSALAASLHLTFNSNICFFQWICFIIWPQPPKAGGFLQELVCLNLTKWHWNVQNEILNGNSKYDPTWNFAKKGIYRNPNNGGWSPKENIRLQVTVSTGVEDTTVAQKKVTLSGQIIL